MFFRVSLDRLTILRLSNQYYWLRECRPLRRWLDEHFIRASEGAWTIDSTAPADQADAEDGTDRHAAQRMMALLRCAVEQQTELTYDDDVLPQHRQRCALPRVRG